VKHLENFFTRHLLNYDDPNEKSVALSITRLCSNTQWVTRKYLTDICCKFLSESDGEKNGEKSLYTRQSYFSLSTVTRQQFIVFIGWH